MVKLNKPTHTFPMLAKTLFGLEDILAGELKEIGAKDIKTSNRLVSFSGDMEMLYKANICLRTAGRILVPLKTFRIIKKEDLYKEVRTINWLDYLKPTDSFVIDSVVNFSKTFTNSMYASQYTKDAIVDQFREKTGKRPSIDPHNPHLRINLHISQREATVSIDSTGEALHKRGYRTEKTLAPLNENLAAGILMLSGYNGDKPFIDPMCGSGTIAIEAALIALNIAPGSLRKSFAFMKWNTYDEKLFKHLVGKAKSEIRKSTKHPIIASDRNKQVIEKAKLHAKKAYVQNAVKFEKISLTDQLPPEGKGVMVCNPPYGERIEVAEIEKLYASLGDSLKQNYQGYDAYIFCGNLQAAKSIGLKTSKRIKLFNGPLECRLLKFELYRGSKKHKPDNES